MQGELRQVADLALFAKIVQTGGISRCAADLGMERTTISRRLGTLERALGVRLLDRSPKRISVTDAGRRCLEQCEQLLESSRNAYSLATIGSISALASSNCQARKRVAARRASLLGAASACECSVSSASRRASSIGLRAWRVGALIG